MRYLRSTLLVAAAALAACSDQSPTGAPLSPTAAPLRSAAPGVGVEGAYIVVLKPGADPRSVAAVAGVKPRFVYERALRGFAGKLTPGQLNALQHNPNVDYIEQDQRGGIATTQSPVTWGLDRIDQRFLPLSNSYTYTATGTGVYAYIIDTGLQASHPQFSGRALNVYDYSGGAGNDCHGHGTHVAGTIGSTTYGVAKNVRLRGVRTIDCFGSGDISWTIAGVDWVALNRNNPAVANISLRWFFVSAALNTAVTNLSNSGVFVALAAGNENDNACNYSPASTPAAVTVAASNSADAKAFFSNWGSCVDLYAPGEAITSTYLGSSTQTWDGTSMASPHVAGVAALYKSTFGNASSATVTNWIINNSTPNVITGNPAGTPNRLLFKSTL